MINGNYGGGRAYLTSVSADSHFMPENLDAIFRRAKEGRVLFTNRDALMPEYIPSHLPFRDQQINFVAQVLAPVLHGSRPSNLLLYGKTGTGKTAVAKYVLSRLGQESTKTDLITAYVNSRIAGTEYRTIGELGELLGVNKENPNYIPFTGLSIGEAVNRIFREIQSSTRKVIFVIDEIDYLVKNYGDGTLYEFTRSAERVSPGFLTLIGISNDIKFKEDLDPRVISSFGEEEIIFPPYNVEEISAILHERATMAFKSTAYSDSAINLCAAMAGSEHGDARRAVDLLRIAGEVAEREGLQTIDDSCIKRASSKMEQDRVEEALRSLPLHNKVILLAASRFENGANTGEVYLAYSQIIKKLQIDLLTQRRVSGILAELDLLGLLEASVVSKGRRGRTKRIRLLIATDTLNNILSEDSALASLY